MRTMVAVHEIPAGDGTDPLDDVSAQPTADAATDEWQRRRLRGFDAEGNVWRLVEVAYRHGPAFGASGVAVSAKNDRAVGRGLAWKPRRWELEFTGAEAVKPTAPPEKPPEEQPPAPPAKNGRPKA